MHVLIRNLRFGIDLPILSYHILIAIHSLPSYLLFSSVLQYLSKKILKKRDDSVVADVYAHMGSFSPRTYSAVLESFPDWFQKEFRHYPTSEKVFREQIAKRILSKQNWANEIDISIVKKIFAKKQINFTVLNSPIKSFVPRPKNIYILNLNESHYNYLRVKPVCPDAKDVFNPKTGRCVKASGKIGQSILGAKKTNVSGIM